MRRKAVQHVCQTCAWQSRSLHLLSRTSRRYVQISATPSSTGPEQSLDSSSPGMADARFEVLGSTFSLLSANISASQNLYTRKGTLVGFNGKPENTVSTLSLLGPLRRAALGISFIYQRISSTTPYTALIATRSTNTSLVVVHLDGRVDWMIAQRNALLAWTGHTLALTPRTNTKISLAHWGNTHVTGRGLLALSGRGQIHQFHLKTGEEYVVHPSNVIAYSQMQHAPQPYRFKATSFRLQVPALNGLLPDTRFWRLTRESAAWKYVSQTAWTVRTWARRTIWGDRLFLHFHGPATILIQSRGGRLRDALTTSDVNEIADAPAGAVPAAIHSKLADSVKPGEGITSVTSRPTTISYATVGSSGTVKFDKEAK